MSATATHICHDCMVKMDYPAIAEHVRSAHGREPMSGPVLAVGDLIRHRGLNWRVTKIHTDGSYEIVPLISIQVEYRMGQWESKPAPEPNEEQQ